MFVELNYFTKIHISYREIIITIIVNILYISSHFCPAQTITRITRWGYFVTVYILFGEFYNLNPFKPEFVIVILIHYKPRIAVAILDL